MSSEVIPDAVNSELISEAAFLLTELRYTLGQLHVQVLDLDDETRRTAQCNGKSIEEMLTGLMSSERDYQQRYIQMLHLSPAESAASDERIPLPVNETDESLGKETSFEHERARTIHILERGGEQWPPELIALVQEQVANDRQVTTNIAECRRSFLEQPLRPDLQEPLTQTEGTPAQ